ncbi:hypothetical protein V6N13_044490 [Hibiscus sabdariffa]
MAAKSGVDRLLGPFSWENKGRSCSFEAFPRCHPLKLITIWLLLLFIGTTYSSKKPDFEGNALIEFLKALNDSGGRITDWNNNLVSPCFSWSHVNCRNGNVISLDLASNGFTGTLSPSIKKLKFLVSFFNGAHLACGSSLEQPCVSPATFPVPTNRSKIRIVVTSASCAALILLSLGALFVSRYYQVQKLKRDVFVDVTGEDDLKISFGQIRRFSWREIQLATDNFNEGNIIGQGGFGRVYKGVLSDNTKVAVKRLADYYSPGGEAAFQREVQLISVAVHKNLLRLIGFCTTSSERILVYPFMQNLSVAYQLRDLKPGDKGLDWPMRKRIAFGAAHGLEYLHEHCNPKIIHRDLKAANILLDDNFKAVLGDFGLAKLVDTKLTHVTTQRAIDFARLEEEEDVLLLDHIKKLLRENRVDDIVDGNLKIYDPKEVETIIRVALLCTQSSPEDRPTMAEVVKMLDGVGLAVRWAEWAELEEVRNREFMHFSHQFTWGEDSTVDQEAIQLSRARPYVLLVKRYGMARKM